MPSTRHEACVELVRQSPHLAGELLTGLGIKLPTYEQARVDAAELTDPLPVELRADTVAVFTAADQPVAAVIVEVQLSDSPDKLYSWPAYLTTLRARLRCPVFLLVIAPDRRTAAWAARPIDCGHPDLVLTPLVCGPEQMPVLLDPADVAATPQLAVLAALAHHRRSERREIFIALIAGLTRIDHDRAQLYYDLVLASLPPAARTDLEDLMGTATREFYSDYMRNLAEKYRAEGDASAVLEVLSARGITIDDTTRERVTSCTDPDQLVTWLRRAATVNSAAEVFA